jgi:hypothetical protein
MTKLNSNDKVYISLDWLNIFLQTHADNTRKCEVMNEMYLVFGKLQGRPNLTVEDVLECWRNEYRRCHGHLIPKWEAKAIATGKTLEEVAYSACHVAAVKNVLAIIKNRRGVWVV